jgi:hypothetical protein
MTEWCSTTQRDEGARAVERNNAYLPHLGLIALVGFSQHHFSNASYMIFFNVTYTCMRPDGAFCISAKNISSGAVDPR